MLMVRGVLLFLYMRVGVILYLCEHRIEMRI